MRILVTGASGFIGSHFVKHLLNDTGHQILALVRQTSHYGQMRMGAWLMHKKWKPSRGMVYYSDLLGDISGLCERVDAVVHFAARTFVDHSIKDVQPFIDNNILATAKLLEDARRYRVKRFVQVSTDEVLGPITNGYADETAMSNPTNPYSATKAGAEALAIAYSRTYGLHTVIPRMENVYGSHQHPQKVFPTFVRHLDEGRKLPVYGDGQHRRQWLWVGDAVRALSLLSEVDVPSGSIWHVASQHELTNIELARKICEAYGRPESEIELIPDWNIRPGHDRRYALSAEKLRSIGWSPQMSLDDGIRCAVNWYKKNPSWSA